MHLDRYAPWYVPVKPKMRRPHPPDTAPPLFGTAQFEVVHGGNGHAKEPALAVGVVRIRVFIFGKPLGC